MSGPNGYYLVARGAMKNPVFRQEPFTEFQAWLWIIESAAWKATRTRIKQFVVEVQRGQVAASVRFMAEAWQWTTQRVQRFLGRLREHEMISLDANSAGVSVLTILNYDAYQAPAQYRHSTGTPTGTVRTTVSETGTGTVGGTVASRKNTSTSTSYDGVGEDDGTVADTVVRTVPDEASGTVLNATGGETGTKKNEKNPEKHLGDGDEDARAIPIAAAPPSPATPVSTSEVRRIGDMVATIIGAKDNPSWFGDYGRIKAWLAQGADEDLILLTVRRVMTNRTEPGPPKNLNYFDGAIARAIAVRNAPMPEVNSHEQQRHSPSVRSSRAPGADPSLGRRATFHAGVAIFGMDAIDSAAE